MVVILSFEQLPLLQERLKQFFPKSILPYHQTSAALEYKWPYLKFMVDKWPEFSSVIIQLSKNGEGFNIFPVDYMIFFTTNEENLKQLLQEPDILPWNEKMVFIMLERQLFEEIVHGKGSLYDFDTVFHMFICAPDKLISSELPPGVKMCQLDRKLASMVNKNWKFGQTGATEKLVENLIKTFPSAGLFDDNDECLAHCLLYSHGPFAIGYTKDEHRGKGYIGHIYQNLAKIRFSRNEIPCALVEKENLASRKSFEKIGFELLPYCYYLIEYTPKEFKKTNI